jgi:hypothetical protein
MNPKPRLGKLVVTLDMLVAGVPLPEKHRAVKIEPHGEAYALLIEGPDMPLVGPDGAVEIVDLETEFEFSLTHDMFDVLRASPIWYFLTSKWKHVDRDPEVVQGFQLNSAQRRMLKAVLRAPRRADVIAALTMDLLTIQPDRTYRCVERGVRAADHYEESIPLDSEHVWGKFGSFGRKVVTS